VTGLFRLAEETGVPLAAVARAHTVALAVFEVDRLWNAVRPLLDLAVFIHVGREKVWARLMKRHAEAGLFTEERNREHIGRVDLPNYDRVEATAPRADLVIDVVSEK